MASKQQYLSHVLQQFLPYLSSMCLLSQCEVEVEKVEILYGLWFIHRQ